MSRIGKQPVDLPSGVEATIAQGSVTVKGPKGSLVYSWGSGVDVKSESKQVLVSLVNKDRQAKANYGSTRAHINNMVKGVTESWRRVLELTGVGFTAKLNGNKLVLNTGYSHEVELAVPVGITCIVDKTRVQVDGIDKELVGTFAATVRRVCPPEPYLGKGIKYSDEQIRRKAGKTGK